MLATKFLTPWSSHLLIFPFPHFPIFIACSELQLGSERSRSGALSPSIYRYIFLLATHIYNSNCMVSRIYRPEIEAPNRIGNEQSIIKSSKVK